MWSDDFFTGKLSGDVIPFEMPLLNAGPLLRAAELPDFSGGQRREKDEKDPGVIASRLEMLEREAYEKGFAAGEEAGLAMGSQKSMVLLGKLEDLIRDISTFRDNTIREMEPQFLELAMSAARQIVIEELTVNPEAVTRITKEALSKMHSQGKITIRTSPSIFETISKKKPELLCAHAEIVFETDPGAPRHGCVISGQEQEIETGLDAQLRNLIKQMAVQVARDKQQVTNKG